MITATEARILVKEYYAQSEEKAKDFCDADLSPLMSLAAKAGHSYYVIAFNQFPAGLHSCDVKKYLEKYGYEVRTEFEGQYKIFWAGEIK